MSSEWQALAAAGIVVFTATVFLFRLARPRKKKSCGHDCGCGK